MKTILKNFFFIIVLFFFSCENSTGVKPSDNTNLIPLKINNHWEYNLIKYRFNPDDSLTTLYDSTSLEMEVTKYDTLDSFTGFQINSLPFSLFITGSPIYYYKDDGFYCAIPPLVVAIPPLPSTEKRLLLFPTNVGDKNNYNDYLITTARTNENVTVYSKKFSCIRYDVTYNADVVGKIWIAPGLGVVKSWQKVGLITNDYFLYSYNLE